MVIHLPSVLNVISTVVGVIGHIITRFRVKPYSRLKYAGS